MNTVTKETLMKFYFGSLEETQRLHIEKEMLKDPEILLDYLDLKRELEAAAIVPQQPSPFLWKRLAPAQKKKVWIFTVATGLAAAAAAFRSEEHTSELQSH